MKINEGDFVRIERGAYIYRVTKIYNLGDFCEAELERTNGMKFLYKSKSHPFGNLQKLEIRESDFEGLNEDSNLYPEYLKNPLFQDVFKLPGETWLRINWRYQISNYGRFVSHYYYHNIERRDRNKFFRDPVYVKRQHNDGEERIELTKNRYSLIKYFFKGEIDWIPSTREKWVLIKGSNSYMVSDFGRFGRPTVTHYLDGTQKDTVSLLNSRGFDHLGYLTVLVYGEFDENIKFQFVKPYTSSKRKYYKDKLVSTNRTAFRLHELIAEHFIPNPNNYKYVAPVNIFDQNNSSATNLKWVIEPVDMNNILVDTCDHEYIYYGNKLIIYDPIDDCWEECYFVSEAEANTAFELFNENGIKMQKKRKN